MPQGTVRVGRLNATVIFETDREINDAELKAIYTAFKAMGGLKRLKRNSVVRVPVDAEVARIAQSLMNS